MGMFTIWLNDYAWFKYTVLGLMGFFVLIAKDPQWYSLYCYLSIMITSSTLHIFWKLDFHNKANIIPNHSFHKGIWVLCHVEIVIVLWKQAACLSIVNLYIVIDDILKNHQGARSLLYRKGLRLSVSSIPTKRGPHMVSWGSSHNCQGSFPKRIVWKLPQDHQ